MHNAQCLDLDLDLDLWMWMWMVEVFMIAVSGVYCNGLLGCGSNSDTTLHGASSCCLSYTPHSLTHSLLSLTPLLFWETEEQNGQPSLSLNWTTGHLTLTFSL